MKDTVVVSSTIILRPGFAPKQTVTSSLLSPVAVVHLGSGATLGTTDPKHLRSLALVALQAAEALEDALDVVFVKGATA